MSTDRIPPFYKRYIDLVVDTNLLTHTLTVNGRDMRQFVSSWTEEMLNYKYAENKWRARDVLVHLLDAERIFAYRALRFARMDQTELPGFDENSYAECYTEDLRTLSELITDMECVRASTVSLFKSFSDKELRRTGTASHVTMSVRSIGEVIAGHELHHRKILIERYFPKKG